MQIAIFGASGATGLLLTERALAAGHHVVALLRKPAEFPYLDRVAFVHGSAFDPIPVLNAVAGSDAVFSALGARSLGKEEVLERAVPRIVDAMHKAGVRRMVALGSAGALPGSLDKQPMWRRWVVRNVAYRILKYPVASQVSQYATLAKSDLDWTMVMPPMLTNGRARGRYRVDGDALPEGGSRISRADVADFMMQQLASKEWSRKGVYLSW
ncbi:MAG TPA: NAD(P)H-binding protein [Granulicella sp.]